MCSPMSSWPCGCGRRRGREGGSGGGREGGREGLIYRAAAWMTRRGDLATANISIDNEEKRGRREGIKVERGGEKRGGRKRRVLHS